MDTDKTDSPDSAGAADAAQRSQGVAEGTTAAGGPSYSIRSDAQARSRPSAASATAGGSGIPGTPAAAAQALEADSQAAGAANPASSGAGEVSAPPRAYAQRAVDSAGRQIWNFNDQVDQLKARGAQWVADEPVRAVLAAAAVGAVFALLLRVAVGGRLPANTGRRRR